MPTPVVSQSTTAPPVPIAYAPGWAPPILTPRGHAVVAALRLRDLVRELDATDRAYLAPFVAEVLVDCATDLPPEAA